MLQSQQNHMESAYLTPGEAAAALGVSTSTVARMADAGKLRVVRPASHRRYVAADVEALIAQEPWEPAS